MKNYLVGSVRPVIKQWGSWKGGGDNANADLDFISYENMYSISRASAEQFLAGDWEEIKTVSPVLDARLFQIAQWYTVRELWFREPCNILCMGSDTLFVKPVEIFDQYNDMMLFNYTDPQTHPEFKHYLNDDVKYFPANMNPSVWELGERLFEQWFTHSESDWAWGQLVHNHMFWSQYPNEKNSDTIPNPLIDPSLVFQYLPYSKEAVESFNSCKFEDAKILHFHGSRNQENRLAAMRDIATDLNISFEQKEEVLLL